MPGASPAFTPLLPIAPLAHPLRLPCCPYAIRPPPGSTQEAAQYSQDATENGFALSSVPPHAILCPP